jgi:hypothetical protein
METEKTENLKVSRFVKACTVVFKTWIQIGRDSCKEENMKTNEQLVAYNVAIELLNKIYSDLLKILDDKNFVSKDINFDEKGHLI